MSFCPPAPVILFAVEARRHRQCRSIIEEAQRRQRAKGPSRGARNLCRAVLSLAFLGILSAHAGETIRVKVPGGVMRGEVKSVNDKEVVLILKNGVEQPIPIQFLTQDQIDRLH